MNRIEEQVPVPNTEFVALIVGRNGKNIKEIRERTNTFIKTPLRNESPIFRIAGTPQNVAKARREILNMVSRRHCHMTQGEDGLLPRITEEFRVPYKLVGLVVGYQGQTVVDVQNKTNTHIQTPPHEGEPIFKITGEAKKVWIAKTMIQLYIESRTGMRVLEDDSFLDESLDPMWLKRLRAEGVETTLNVLWSVLDPLEPGDYLYAATAAQSPATSVPALCQDPIEAMAMQLSALDMDSSNDLNQSVPFEPEIDTNGVVAQDPFSPTVDYFYNAAQPSLDLVTQSSINELFPDESTPLACDSPVMTLADWLVGMGQTSQQQQQQQPQQQQLYHAPITPPAAPSPVMAAKNGELLLDNTFWEYVADINDLPAEQVL